MRVSRQYKRRRLNIIKLCAAIIIFAIIVSAGITCKAMISQAGSGSIQESSVQYKQITVKAGDSIWSIAAENLPECYADVDSYVDDILEINNYSSNTRLMSGTKLIVPYYADSSILDVAVK